MLNGKTVLLIGAGGLIGASLARACFDAGAAVVAAGRNPENPNLVALRRATGGEFPFVRVDVANPESVEALFDLAESKAGKVDAVVNCSFPRNAAFGKNFDDVAFADFCDNVVTHLGGAFLVCQKSVAYFTRTGGGTIVNFSSIYGLMAPRFEIYEGTAMTKEPEYIVCKSAIIHLTKYLAKYVKGRNIRVNCVSPGGVKDSQSEDFIRRYNEHCLNKGMLDGADVAGTVVFLLSDQSRFVNGQNIVVDDGFSL